MLIGIGTYLLATFQLLFTNVTRESKNTKVIIQITMRLLGSFSFPFKWKLDCSDNPTLLLHISTI